MRSNHLTLDFDQRSNFISSELSDTLLDLDILEANVNFLLTVEMVKVIEAKVFRTATQEWVESVKFFFYSIR